MVDYEKKGEQFILTQGDKIKRLPRQAVEAVMFSMNYSEKEAVEYQAKHVMPEPSPIPPVPTPPPKPEPEPKLEPEPEPEDEEDEAGKDVIDEILESDEGEDEEEEADEEDEDLEDKEEEEEEEGLTEEERTELIKELEKGIKNEKKWNNYKWLMSIAGNLEYFDGPGTPKKDKASIQKWLKKQIS